MHQEPTASFHRSGSDHSRTGFHLDYSPILLVQKRPNGAVLKTHGRLWNHVRESAQKKIYDGHQKQVIRSSRYDSLYLYLLVWHLMSSSDERLRTALQPRKLSSSGSTQVNRVFFAGQGRARGEAEGKGVRGRGRGGRHGSWHGPAHPVWGLACFRGFPWHQCPAWPPARTPGQTPEPPKPGVSWIAGLGLLEVF